MEENVNDLTLRLVRVIIKIIVFVVVCGVLILSGITGVFIVAHIALGVFDYYLTVDKFAAGVVLILLIRLLLFAKINKKS